MPSDIVIQAHLSEMKFSCRKVYHERENKYGNLEVKGTVQRRSNG